MRWSFLVLGWGLIASGLHLSPSPLVARQSSLETVQWIARADSLRELGELEAAEKIYKRILRRHKKNIAAISGLGKIDIAREKWGKAGGKFDKILKWDPDNIEAHYYRAIAHRETGKFKALLLRKLDWDNARKHFLHVIERNRRFRDVLFQYAVLKRYREKFEEAVALGQEQIELKPDLPGVRAGLLWLYRALIRHRSADQAESWLKRQVWDQARYALAELWRRQGKLDQADSLVQDLLARPLRMSRQPLYLMLAKIYYAQKKPEMAQRFYWRAVDSIQDDVDARMVFENVKYILSESELEAYGRLQTVPEKIRFFRKFWARRDPTPAANYNIRLREHFERLMYAEKYYEFDGFRTWFNSPDKFKYLKFPATYRLSNEFNDKGLIYIRHGPPDEREVTVTASAPTNESWRYWKRGDQPEMIFHFVIDKNAAGNNWRLTPIITHPQMLADRVTWGNVYHRLLNARPFEILELETEMAEESAKAVEVGFETDRHSWPDSIRALDFRYLPATFRGPNDSTLVEIFYAVPLQPLIDKYGEGSELRFEQGLAIEDTVTWRMHYRTVRFSVLKPEQIRTGGDVSFIERFLFKLPPGPYRASLHIRPENTPWLGGYQFDLEVPDYATQQLSMSDLQLAFQIQPAPPQKTKFVKGDLQVVVNPMSRFARNQPVYAYFEIYNLQVDDGGIARYRILYTLKLLKSTRKGLKKVFGWFGGGGKSSISLSTERENPGPTAIEWVSFDVGKMKPGEYEMVIKIQDRLTRAEIEKSMSLWLY